jgi:hypothetical protein
MTTTSEAMDDLEGLLEKKTPGAWSFFHEEGWSNAWVKGPPTGYEGEFLNPPDAKLMSLAPTLAAEVIRLHAENARLRAAGEGLYGDLQATSFGMKLPSLTTWRNTVGEEPQK